MKKAFRLCLAALMIVACLSGCKKDKEPEVELTITPITLEEAKNAIERVDETVKKLNGTYKITSDTTEKTNSKTTVSYQGEDDEIEYVAEYVITRTMDEKGSIATSLELISSTQTGKQKENTNNNPGGENNQGQESNQGSEENNNAPEGPNGTSEDDPTKYLTMIEKYYTDKKYDSASLSNVKVEGNKIICDVAAEERYRYISDVNYLHAEFYINGESVSISSESLKEQDTISNFTGKYVQKDYNGYFSDKMKPFIVFDRYWSFEMYVIAPEDVFGTNPILISSGSYSINNTVITMKPRNGWKNNGYSIGGGSEIGLVPNNGTDAINFTITVVNINDVTISEKIGTSASGAHFVKE